MTWIIKRSGPYGYLKSKDTLAPYSSQQSDALRFDKKWKATRAAKNWEACWSSSQPVYVVKLVPRIDWPAEALRLRKALASLQACGNCDLCPKVIRHVLLEPTVTHPLRDTQKGGAGR